ncbi:1-deoxy-D-xylulose-5-phosphate reductoisomerase [Candidatus Pelagibacter sp. HIMB1517]|uniref:1-deoxy-D-xylulose-5-phosphate reductoisomerase n=1 Tax=Candidatus Pelagibacter sp. HIMB1517 TaxID=3413341 RepID=UPI003F858ADD
MKTLAIIGSTGSIGNSALKVYKNHKKKFKLIYLCANSNIAKLSKQIKEFKPQNAFLLDDKKIPKNKNLKLLNKNYALRYKQKKIDYVISGVSGYDSLNINLKLVRISKNLLIANKETIICGSNYFLDYAKKNNCNIIPIDSEHYCLNFFIKNFNIQNLIDEVYLVASGGPFLEKKIRYNENVKNVISHPTWKMGKKISVDSSTFANKILELFEAKILFKLNKNKIKILIEKKSNVHAIIKLKNNLYFPIMHKPNMIIAISNSLNVTNYFKMQLENLKIFFKEPDLKKFPIIKLGYKILRNYNNAGALLFTVINQRLVELYLKGKINYGEISHILVKVFKQKKLINLSRKKLNNLNDINRLIEFGQELKL